MSKHGTMMHKLPWHTQNPAIGGSFIWWWWDAVGLELLEHGLLVLPRPNPIKSDGEASLPASILLQLSGTTRIDLGNDGTVIRSVVPRSAKADLPEFSSVG